MKIIGLYFMAALTLLIGVGCATTYQSVPLPDLNKEIENPEMGRIYVVRPSGFGSGISMSIMDNDRKIGETGPNGFLCWERERGKAEIVGKAENTSKVSLDVNSGNVYYIHQHVQLGLLFARNKLEVVDKEKGEKFLGKCKPPVSGK